MPEYLSDEWLAALDRALRDVRALQPLAVEQVVTGVPGRGEVRYRVWVDGEGGHARAAYSDDPAADLRLTTDYPTAVGIVKGAQNAQIALAHGRLRIGGNLESIASYGRALGALADVAAQLRDTTTFAAP